MARAIGSSTPSRTASPKPASPPILRLHNPSILTRARSARSEHVPSHSHGEGGRLAPFSMANHWLPFTPAHWFPFTPALTPDRTEAQRQHWQQLLDDARATLGPRPSRSGCSRLQGVLTWTAGLRNL